MGIEKFILEAVQNHLDQKLAQLEADYRSKLVQIEQHYIADRYYTTKEAANYLSTSDIQLCKWVKSGQLNRYNFGHKMYRFRKSELDAFVRQAKEEKEPKPKPAPSLFIQKSVFQEKKKAVK